MAPRKKATTPVRKSQIDTPKAETRARKREPLPRSSNGHASGHDLMDGHDIAVLAYELYVQRGGEHGHDLEDWLAAERRLSGREG